MISCHKKPSPSSILSADNKASPLCRLSNWQSASYIFVNEQHLGTDLVDTQTKSIELTSNGLVSIEAYICIIFDGPWRRCYVVLALVINFSNVGSIQDMSKILTNVPKYGINFRKQIKSRKLAHFLCFCDLMLLEEHLGHYTANALSLILQGN